MLVTNLPDIRLAYSDGDDLRWDTAQAITAVEIAASRGDGGKASAAALRDFFIAAANAANVASGETEKKVALA
ncbi:hypothetical protein KTE28_18330 [Burkholderia multivorans]|uniref:hypothetical protein n=1 Tax=Burkholderia multivorans TaxID=87883 RepID=UPI000D008821|nr:hypothetical protein [Burkholderia multivorans]MBU9144951.1 hypothetical protein [Burkholderia multivorans]MBU9376286.1 hypothetical protein [Burkholderia multivorans]MBU9528217.1 hypothetical protein [Burkholderia multivorans]MBU9540064.1 hypothetical protein [Burkholderia multivorans]MDI3300005.1 hypothetical protein [Burkholderia multivorans]